MTQGDKPLNLRLWAIFALCLFAARPVYALEFDAFLLGRPLSTTLQPTDSVPVVQGGETRQWFPASSFMRQDGSNAILPDARTRILPTPTLNNCLIGTGTDWASASCLGATGMTTDAANAILPDARTYLGLGTASQPQFNSLGLGTPPQVLGGTLSLAPAYGFGPWNAPFLDLNYGNLASPYFTHPSYGIQGIGSRIYVTPGTGLADAFSAAFSGAAHLSGGTKGIALGGYFGGFTDGTWETGGSIDAGSIGIWAEGKSSRGGAVFGGEFLAQADTTAIATSAQGIEIDTAIAVSVGSKFGVAINSTVTDTGAITGTTTIFGSGLTVPNGAFYLAQSQGGNFPFVLLTPRATGGIAPIAATGSLWRSGGYPVVTGLDWPDMTFTGHAIKTPGFTVDGSGNLAANVFKIGAIQIISNNSYTYIRDGSGVVDVILLGPTGDPTNYYDRTTHQFRIGGGAANVAAISASGMTVGAAPTGGFKGAGTINAGGPIYDNGTAPSGTAGSGYAHIDSPTFTGNVNIAAATATSLTGLGNPTVDSDAATKAYVDGVASGSTWHASVQAGTTANLNVVAAGTGVGHTLTNNGALAALVLDGYTVGLNEDVLVKDQTAQDDNGIYKQTTLGTGAIAWVLTRRTDFDQATASEVAQGATLIVINGTAAPGNANSQWVETGVGPFTVDTTSIVFTRTAAASNGTVNSGTINQFGVYAAAGTTISGQSFTGLMKGNGTSAPSVYSGASCTNQFPRSLDLNGAATCASVANTDLAGGIDLTTKVTGALPVANGGIGVATLTGIAQGNGTGAFTAVAAPAGIIVGTTDTQTLSNKSIVGTATNDNACVGCVGEVLSATGAAVAVTSTTQTNITSRALTPGDWDVSGNIKFNPAATTTSTIRAGGLSLTSATLPVSISVSESLARETGAITAGQGGWTAALGTVRVSTAGTPTVYCVGRFTFATSTATADCVIYARRVR